MPKKEHNWIVGGLTLVLTLAVLFGGQFLWNKYAVANPINRMSQNIEGVEAVTVGQLHDRGKSNEKIKIYVKLKNVPNIQALYGKIGESLDQVSGSKKYEIVIQDSRTPELEQFYYAVHYHIQEAIFTGNFADMAEHIQTQASRAGIAVQVYVDVDNVYLKISKDAAEMYAVIARNTSNVQGVK